MSKRNILTNYLLYCVNFLGKTGFIGSVATRSSPFVLALQRHNFKILLIAKFLVDLTLFLFDL
jgi:hypothetical protein